MQYLNDPLIESPAHIIVIPVQIGGFVPKGSIHAEFLENSPREYVSEYYNVIKPDMINGGLRTFQNKVGRWKGVWFLHFPVGEVEMWKSWRHSLDRVFNVMKCAKDLRTIAIPRLGNWLPWEVQLGVFEMYESERIREHGQEVWAYSPEDDEWEDETAIVVSVDDAIEVISHS